MKRIADIRLYESDIPNVDYNSLPHDLGRIYDYDHMACLEVIQRLLFLLRHRGFGFEKFDHLYVNFTPCVPQSEVRNVNRSYQYEHARIRYVDVGCDMEIFNSWDQDAKQNFVLNGIKQAVLLKAPEEMRELFSQTFDEVLKQGDNLLIPYKEKENADYRVEVLTRIDDDVDFLPLIRVTDKEGNVVAEKQLRGYGRDEFISQISTITIGKRYVKIANRKNWYADFYDLKPIRIEW